MHLTSFNSLDFIFLPLFRNIISQRIIRIWCTKKGLDREENCTNLKSWAPFICWRKKKLTSIHKSMKHNRSNWLFHFTLPNVETSLHILQANVICSVWFSKFSFLHINLPYSIHIFRDCLLCLTVSMFSVNFVADWREICEFVNKE